jgi:hypothetical protein
MAWSLGEAMRDRLPMILLLSAMMIICFALAYLAFGPWP